MKMDRYLAICAGAVLLILLLVAIWRAWKVTAAYSSLFTVQGTFRNTQRYLVTEQGHTLVLLDRVTLSVARRDTSSSEEAVLSWLRELLDTQLVRPLTDSVLVQEATLFALPPDVSELRLRRQPYDKEVTLENLAVTYFKQLAPLLRREGLALSKLTLHAADVSFEYGDRKFSKYFTLK